MLERQTIALSRVVEGVHAVYDMMHEFRTESTRRVSPAVGFAKRGLKLPTINHKQPQRAPWRWRKMLELPKGWANARAITPKCHYFKISSLFHFVTRTFVPFIPHTNKHNVKCEKLKLKQPKTGFCFVCREEIFEISNASVMFTKVIYKLPLGGPFVFSPFVAHACVACCNDTATFHHIANRILKYAPCTKHFTKRVPKRAKYHHLPHILKHLPRKYLSQFTRRKISIFITIAIARIKLCGNSAPNRF